MRLRAWWVSAHRWTALSLGVLLLAAAFTGSLLVLARPLDRALHPYLFVAQDPGAVDLQPLVERLRIEFGPQAAFNLRLPQPGQTLQVLVSGPWNGTLYLDPVSGFERGRRAVDEGFLQVLFEFHSTLLAGDTGRAVLAWAALAYVVLLGSGAVLWWPLRRRWRVRAKAGMLPFLFDAHRVTGAVSSLLILVSVVTGAYLAWRPLAGWVSALGGPRPVATAPGLVARPGEMAPRTVDAAIALAQAQWHGAVATAVQVPPRAIAASQVRLRLPDDDHPIGMSVVSLDPVTGMVQAARRWNRREAGTRAFSLVYPLHTGQLYGVGHQAVVCLTGMALVGLGWSGLWLWWRRRLSTALAAVAPSHAAPARSCRHRCPPRTPGTARAAIHRSRRPPSRPPSR